jgi:hypothetical protein
MILRKIEQNHAAELARLHMGKYQLPKRPWEIRSRYNLPAEAPDEELAPWLIHQKALEALDAIGADAATFRAMLKENIDTIQLYWEDLRIDREEEARLAARRKAQHAQEQQKAREEAHAVEQQRVILRADLERHVSALQALRKMAATYGLATGLCLLVAGSMIVSAIDKWSVDRADSYGRLGSAGCVTIVAILAYLARKGCQTRLQKMRRDWDEGFRTNVGNSKAAYALGAMLGRRLRMLFRK